MYVRENERARERNERDRVRMRVAERRSGRESEWVRGRETARERERDCLDETTEDVQRMRARACVLGGGGGERAAWVGGWVGGCVRVCRTAAEKDPHLACQRPTSHTCPPIIYIYKNRLGRSLIFDLY
jgi:hypothetical protein